jgi:GAF domain-containing protein/HAMP domain-containing protein
LVALFFSIGELAAILMTGSRQIWAVFPVFIAAPIAYWLNRTGKQVQGSILLLLALNLQFFFVLWVYDNISLMNSVTSLVLAGVLCLVTLPREFFGRVLVSALVTLIIAFFFDLFSGPGSLGTGLNTGIWIFLFLMLAVFAFFSTRDFLSWDIRTKIVTGILGTGALALAIFIFFVFNQSQQVTDALQARLDKSVSRSAEDQLVNQALREANTANESFEDIAEQVVSLAQNWSTLQSQSYALNRTPYWDAGSELVQLEGGQYGNSATDPSSVFVPIGIQLDDTLIRDLNVSAYLDFSAPEVLRKYPSLLAVYAIDTRGSTRYYPNIELASKVPPDFNPAQRPYYTITAPLFNPQRQSRWAIPYIDKTGGGMVVTVAAPVYNGDRFMGIVAADMQLTGIAERINSIKAGQTGYAYIVDDAGRIIAMPDAGLAMFGLRKEDITPETFEKLTLLGLGSHELQSATFRMTSGGSGLLTANVDGKDTYISFAPIKANGYSVALVVPVAELQGETIAARAQTNQQIQVALRTAAVILVLLFAVAVAVSLGLGQVIAGPIQRLTHVSTQIAGGDLSVQASANTQDEIGTLASSFNTMTSRLRETLDGLERMVEERTAELLAANERNERRAKQFESIAQVSRTISSTRDFNVLLPQITTLISREFGFYHVGIFLLDAAKEYAILSAANSEGGQVMLKRGHRLKVGETGIVGHVTGTGAPRVALDTGADAVFFNNPDLPNTHSEIALPLRAGEEIIGALDVQSTQPDAFSQEDISILSTLADQVSVAIQNARQFEQTHTALSEAEALAKQFSKTGWQQYTKDKSLIGIHHTGAKATLLYEKDGQETEENSWDMGPAKNQSRGAFLALPIQLRGETIGAVNVRSPDNRPWDQDEMDIVTAIIERAAIAMENARLLEESQRLASKEAKIGAVTAKIGASINIRNVLQTAVEELGRALPGSEVVIQFQGDQNKNKAT